MPPRQQGTTLTPKMVRDIQKLYHPNVKGSGYGAVAAKLGISKGAVEKVIASGSVSQHLKKTRGRKRKLTQAEESKIKRRSISHTYDTNKQLAARVEGKIKPRTVSDVLHRGNPEITLHRAVDQEPEELGKEWKQMVLSFINNTLRRIRLDRRIYEDETAIYGNEAPRLGRAPKGKKLYRARKRYVKKYTLHVYAKKSGVLYWELRDKNANDYEIKTVASSAMAKMKRGDLLLWDRLGKSGRCLHPIRQHFNPEVISKLDRKGVEVIHLPPKGKYLNPLELLFGDLKEHYIRPQFPPSGRELSKKELKAMIRNYMEQQAPINLPKFFRKRANGRELQNKLL
jgi:hypothetical protein